MQLLLATGNPKKVDELRALLAGSGVDVLVPADVGGLEEVGGEDAGVGVPAEDGDGTGGRADAEATVVIDEALQDGVGGGAVAGGDEPEQGGGVAPVTAVNRGQELLVAGSPQS